MTRYRTHTYNLIWYLYQHYYKHEDYKYCWLFVVACKYNFPLIYDMNTEDKEQPKKSLNS